MNVECEAKLTLDLEALMASNDRKHPHESLEDDPSDTKSSLEKIKRQLSAGSGSVPLQGPLFKRSETLRKWNQRWFTLDPATGRMEYRLERGDVTPRGLIYFDGDSTITISPINFHGAQKYDGCCFYVGSPHKKEYYFCAESQAVARAWVGTLRAAALVLKAHKEAVTSLSGNGVAKLGTVAAVVTAANSIAKEAAGDIAAEMQSSLKVALSGKSSQAPPDTDVRMDDLSIMKETLRVKDEELHQLSKELRARDLTIKELAKQLSDTADAADAAAKAAHTMDRERKAARHEADRARRELDDRTKVAMLQLKAGEERFTAAVKERNEALQDSQRLQRELAKAKELETNGRKALADLEELLKARDAELAALVSKEKTISTEFSRPATTVSQPADQTHGTENGGVEQELPERNVSVNSDESEGERASNPDAEPDKEAVKSEVIQNPTVVETVPNEREVLIDTYSADVDVPTSVHEQL